MTATYCGASAFNSVRQLASGTSTRRMPCAKSIARVLSPTACPQASGQASRGASFAGTRRNALATIFSRPAAACSIGRFIFNLYLSRKEISILALPVSPAILRRRKLLAHEFHGCIPVAQAALELSVFNCSENLFELRTRRVAGIDQIVAGNQRNRPHNFRRHRRHLFAYKG